jgi:peptidoglycan/LPS O-acetylase OafA/YrhL
MVFAFSFGRGVFSKFLANRMLVYLGESSCCLYMIHLMFLGYVVPRLFIDIDKNSIVSVLVVLALMAICVVPLSWLLHSAVEKPL